MYSYTAIGLTVNRVWAEVSSAKISHHSTESIDPLPNC